MGCSTSAHGQDVSSVEATEGKAAREAAEAAREARAALAQERLRDRQEKLASMIASLEMQSHAPIVVSAERKAPVEHDAHRGSWRAETAKKVEEEEEEEEEEGPAKDTCFSSSDTASTRQSTGDDASRETSKDTVSLDTTGHQNQLLEDEAMAAQGSLTASLDTQNHVPRVVFAEGKAPDEHDACRGKWRAETAKKEESGPAEDEAAKELEQLIHRVMLQKVSLETTFHQSQSLENKAMNAHGADIKPDELVPADVGSLTASLDRKRHVPSGVLAETVRPLDEHGARRGSWRAETAKKEEEGSAEDEAAKEMQNLIHKVMLQKMSLDRLA